MRIPIVCAKCGNDFSAPETFVGRKAVCPACGTGVRVPDPGTGVGGRSASRRGSPGGLKGLKLGLMVVGGVVALVLIAMAWEKMPSLSQMNVAAIPVQNTGPNSPETIPAESPQPEHTDTEDPAEVARPPSISETPALPPETKPPRAVPPPKRPPQAVSKQTRAAAAVEEYDTDRGQRLFANVKRVVIVRGGKENAQLNPNNPQAPDSRVAIPNVPNNNNNNRNTKNKNPDPREAIWTEIVANGRHVIEKMGLDESAKKADQEAAVLTITVDVQPSEKGTPGTKEISISAELTCADPSAGSRSMTYAKVWKAEQDLGTISGKSSKTGKLPNSVEGQLTKFFGKFRGAYNQAVQAAKEADEAESEE